MAKMRRLRDGLILPISGQCLLGRGAGAAIRLEERFASSEQARFDWTGTQWCLRDLGSRNGTFLDEERLEPGSTMPLTVGARLGFGEPSPSWSLEDLSAPKAMALELATGTWHEADQDLLPLPSRDQPSATLYPSPDGIGWVLEREEGTIERIESQTVIEVAGRDFRVDLPAESEPTPLLAAAMTLEQVSLRFLVSQDEERVELSVVFAGREHRLEAREHSYLLLCLARMRLEDAALDPAEQGWRTLAQLERSMRRDSNSINVAIHRARQRLSALGVVGASGIVEVRRGQRRFGTARFTIQRATS